MTGEVQIHALPKAFSPGKRLQHANDLRTFFVDGERVEIIDLLIGVRPNRVCHRARVFRKLRCAKHTHIVDPLDRAGARSSRWAFALRSHHVGGELLIAKYRETFLERELKPVTAGHPVAGPIMEIFVRHHRLHRCKVLVSRQPRMREHIAGVEDVEALVLHCPHVEVAGGDNHESIKVEFQPIARFIPPDRTFKRTHRMFGLVLVAGLDPNLEERRAPRPPDEGRFRDHQTSRHQREKIAGLGERILPGAPVPAGSHGARVRVHAIAVALGDEIAVGEQHWPARALCAKRHAIARHDIGAVGKKRDPSKALCLALGVEIFVRHIETAQCGVRLGRTPRGDVEHKLRGYTRYHQLIVSMREGLRPEQLTVNGHCEQLQRLAIELQRLGGAHASRAAHDEARAHQGGLRIQVDTELDRINGISGRPVIGPMNRHALIGTHGDSSFDRFILGVQRTAQSLDTCALRGQDFMPAPTASPPDRLIPARRDRQPGVRRS